MPVLHRAEGGNEMNCDVCGKAVRFSARAFKLRNGAEITICASCVVESKPTNPASSGIAERAKKEAKT